MKDDQKYGKLVCLYIIDCMSVPVSQELINTIAVENKWFESIQFDNVFNSLIESDFITEVLQKKDIPYYYLTEDGKSCLASLYEELPLTLRESMRNIIDAKRVDYKRNDAYKSDYTKNSDGSYTVMLKINSTPMPALQLSITIPDKSKAKYISQSWKQNNKAFKVYEKILEILIEDNFDDSDD